MNTNIPSKIHSYNLYNDDLGGRFFGVGDECALPDFEQLVETLSGAGILGELDDPAPGHYSNQQMEIPFRVLDEEPISLMDTTKAVKLTMRGALQSLTSEGDTAFRPLKVVVRGKCATLKLGTLKAATAMNSSVTLNISYIKISLNGKELVELDKLNGIFKIDGKDVLQKVREMT